MQMLERGPSKVRFQSYINLWKSLIILGGIKLFIYLCIPDRVLLEAHPI